MSKRSIPEINAGSMADIAFLLLVFWLVATTMDRDMGLKVRLPAKIDAPVEPHIVWDRNVLEILLNGEDKLRIEDEDHLIEDVKGFVEDFYLSDSDNMPFRTMVSEQTVADTLARLEQRIQQTEAATTSSNQLYTLGKLNSLKEEWEGYRASRNLIGDFKVMSKRAVIRFESNNGTTYEAYFKVLDQINSVLKDERNKLAKQAFDMSYDYMMTLKDTDPSVRPKIRAVRHRFPMRLLEPTARGNN